MRVCSTRLVVMMGFMWCLGPGLSQTGDSNVSGGREVADVRMYQSFFRQVSQLKRASEPVLLNGNPSSLVQMRLEDIGLTEGEQRLLSEISADCDIRSREIDDALKPLVFEGRMQALESEHPDESIVKQLAEVSGSRDQMVRFYIEKLKSGLGVSHFEMLDGFIRARRNDALFFPVVSSPPVPAKKR
jgi:hypothetical protein